jgi:hypothetical protein
MSAQRELIAAALKLTALAERNTDDGDEWQRAILDVREAVCEANAMVQPDIAEVERLIDSYSVNLVLVAKLTDSREYDKPHQESRTALLDAVRAIVAERDALKHDVERLMQIVSQEVSK